MVGRLRDAIRQRRPFGSLEAEAFLNLEHTADALMRGLVDLLKGADLSPTQYNVLRILRGAGPGGLACGEIGERMVTRDPDITRLLDRLERRGLIARTRDARDRRVVTANITRGGIDVLVGLDRPVADLHARQLSHLGNRSLEQLIDLLEKARDGRPPRSATAASPISAV
jgi:DNA-binding MarR family transcriptional regulator